MQVEGKWHLFLSMALLLVVVASMLCHATPEGNVLHLIGGRLHAEMNWTGSDSCKGWEGVKCYQNHVVELIIPGKGLYGTIPREISKLPFLKVLDLSNNQINGSIPLEISDLPNLQTLNLYNNYLTGKFPTWLSRLNAKVYLGCNYFTGPKPVGFDEHSYTGNCLDSDMASHMKFCVGSPNCVSFYSQPENARPAFRLQRHKRNHTWVIVGCSVLAILVLGIVLVATYAWKMKKKKKERTEMLLGTQSSAENGTIEPWEPPTGIRKFYLKEILKATNRFSKTYEIGFGGFGKVYKGYFDDGSVLAIKRASPSSIQGHKQFQNEIIVLSRVHHRCLVKLEGFCHESGEQVLKGDLLSCILQILVYEFMKNGNLNNLIWGNNKNQNFNWQKRIKIAISIAQGLDYLHSNADPPVIHRDVKPSNVLLDDYFNAKLSDFGISKLKLESANTHISTMPAGTNGYLDPQYVMRNQLTTSSDVYSFGIVLLVLITGQRPVDNLQLDEYNLVEWVNIKFQEDDMKSIVDTGIGDGYLPEDFRTVTQLALKCAAFEGSERPSMKDVLLVLEPLLNKITYQEEKGNSHGFDYKGSARRFPLSREYSLSVEAFTSQQSNLSSDSTLTRSLSMF